jgi:nitroreductase
MDASRLEATLVCNIDEVLTTTRAVRKRLDLSRPVPRALLLDCVRVASQAPTGKGLQLWRWVIVDDPDQKASLAKLYRECYQAYIAPERVTALARADEHAERIIGSADHLAEVLHQVPALVVPCLLGRPPADRGAAALSEFYGSIMPAVWSFQLAARTRGLGTSLTTVHLHREAEAAQVLGIPDTVTQAALIPVAYYLGDTFRPAQRRPPEDVVFWNGWNGRSRDTGLKTRRSEET